jgi:hypothetical protein
VPKGSSALRTLGTHHGNQSVDLLLRVGSRGDGGIGVPLGGRGVCGNEVEVLPVLDVREEERSQGCGHKPRVVCSKSTGDRVPDDVQIAQIRTEDCARPHRADVVVTENQIFEVRKPVHRTDLDRVDQVVPQVAARGTACCGIFRGVEAYRYYRLVGGSGAHSSTRAPERAEGCSWRECMQRHAEAYRDTLGPEALVGTGAEI